MSSFRIIFSPLYCYHSLIAEIKSCVSHKYFAMHRNICFLRVQQYVGKTLVVHKSLYLVNERKIQK